MMFLSIVKHQLPAVASLLCCSCKPKHGSNDRSAEAVVARHHRRSVAEHHSKTTQNSAVITSGGATDNEYPTCLSIAMKDKAS
jgi:outer membrane biogenesis lipoprotein LolB